ncbi:DoxX family protein [Nocardiopsis tropica]|uniref:DoxX family protein n=1 Tax=Nocardiopsis tropica TaxID=109330 RepID=A0ABU7KXP9_9ACTN|nr:DoxX family protein [Nocardiopsis umidischolae]MEE2054050.1 DoxX family protein [Nocardiopsis umidischolae]
MTAAYIAVTVLTAAANGFFAVADLLRARFVLANSAAVGVPESWLTTLGLLKGAGALGLLLGLAGVPVVGTAAALGLVLFFVGAVAVHLRAPDLSLLVPLGFLGAAAGALFLSLAV